MQIDNEEDNGWFASEEPSSIFTATEQTSFWNRSADQARDDLIVVTIWLIMLTYAFVSNVLIVYGILKSQTMRTATSYWFIISLAVCDIVMCIISLVHLVPATAFHSDFVQYMSTRNIVMIFIYDLFWYTAVLQLALMAVNRFVSIVYPMEYKWMFSQQRAVVIIIFMYLLGFLSALPTLFPCCHTLWNSDFYITVYDPMDTWYKYIDVSINSISLFLMVISYIVIIYKVRASSKAMAKYQLTIRTRVSKKEMRLFIQFFVVSLVFLITWTTWQWLPTIYHSKWAYFVMTSLFFINNSVNPTVYLLFNTQLRRELHYLLCRNHAIAAAQHRRKRTFLNRHADASHQGAGTELQNGIVASSTASNPNEVSQSSNSSSNEYPFTKDPRRFLIHNGGAITCKSVGGGVGSGKPAGTVMISDETTEEPAVAAVSHRAALLSERSGGFSVL